MAEPVEFTIKAEGKTWTLARDGHHLADYSHLEQATHEAVRRARELEETGEPAKVFVHAAEGKVIEIDAAVDITREQELHGAEAEPPR